MLPSKGRGAAEVLAELDALSAGDADLTSGRVLAGYYDAGPAVSAIARAAYLRYLDQNALFFSNFPSVSVLERFVIDSVRTALRADDDACGMVTSGGTESIMLAVKVARDVGLARGIDAPRIVVPVSGHPAFHKAAHYLGMEVDVTPLVPDSFGADVDAMRAAVRRETVLLVGSAPNYSHGVVDPIREIAALGEEIRALVHVDACVGGWYLGVRRSSGVDVADFDFSVPGVTSMSVDLHKYGFVPKNCSTVVFRSRALREHAVFVNSATTEYLVINPTVQSSRTAGPLAAAWAVMQFLGLEGYQRLFEDLDQAAGKLRLGIEDIPSLAVLGDPDVPMMAVAAAARTPTRMVELESALAERGWRTHSQPACDVSPETLHLTVTPGQVPLVDELLADLSACATVIDARPLLDHVELARRVSAVAGRTDVVASLLGSLDGDIAGRGGILAQLAASLFMLEPEARDRAVRRYFSANLLP